MVKRKRHIWFFISGIGTTNLIMVLAIYYGIAAWVSKIFTEMVHAYPLYMYGAAAIGGIVPLGAGIRLIIRTRQDIAAKNGNEGEETDATISQEIIPYNISRPAGRNIRPEVLKWYTGTNGKLEF